MNRGIFYIHRNKTTQDSEAEKKRIEDNSHTDQEGAFAPCLYRTL